jgi:hypothetical protein
MTRRLVAAAVGVLLAPIVLTMVVVTIATVTGHARPIGRMWQGGLDT